MMNGMRLWAPGFCGRDLCCWFWWRAWCSFQVIYLRVLPVPQWTWSKTNLVALAASSDVAFDFDTVAPVLSVGEERAFQKIPHNCFLCVYGVLVFCLWLKCRMAPWMSLMLQVRSPEGSTPPFPYVPTQLGSGFPGTGGLALK